jgi:multisubunit Na+/H+ antiporter MnhC subunit
MDAANLYTRGQSDERHQTHRLAALLASISLYALGVGVVTLLLTRLTGAVVASSTSRPILQLAVATAVVVGAGLAYFPIRVRIEINKHRRN